MIVAIKILCYIIFAYGLSNMVVYSRGPFGIFEWWRGFMHNINDNLGELFTCMICFPTWLGIGISILDIFFSSFTITPFNVLLDNNAPYWLIVVLDACFTSGIVWLIDVLETALQSKED